MHKCDPKRVDEIAVWRLINLFNGLFQERYHTQLLPGGDEPVYLPADQQYDYHRIIFAHGFFNSALHEIAHWCIAGPQRRLLPDFGYWYQPDGRSLEQQSQFEQVEVKPQALEWILARCCQRRFRISVDNLALLEKGIEPDTSGFKQQVYLEVQRRLEQAMTPRICQLTQALINEFNPGFVLTQGAFDLCEL